MVERRSYTPEIGLWKGSDIVSTKRVIIEQQTDSPIEIPVLIARDSLPAISLPLKASVKSRFAQAGLDIDYKTGINLLQQVLVHKNGNAVNGEPFEASVRIINRSTRPIEVLSGTGLFRLFGETASPLSGNSLVEMIRSGGIRIEGKEGIDWEWAYAEYGKTPVGLYARINRNNRRWISPDPENKPILIDNNVEDYRKVLDGFLEDIPEGDDNILWIGETARLTLNGVDTILDEVACRYPNQKYSRGSGIQINSRLIDDKKTDWAIRVEILSKTTRTEIPDYVKMHFIKSNI